MSAWAAFWLVVAVFIVCECIIYLNGHDTLFWAHKTAAEKRLQSKQIDATKEKGGAA